MVTSIAYEYGCPALSPAETRVFFCFVFCFFVFLGFLSKFFFF